MPSLDSAAEPGPAGARSKNAPPGTSEAVVVNLVIARWLIYGPILLATVIIGLLSVLNRPPLGLVVGISIFGLVLPLMVVAFLLSPWATPAKVAFEGSNLWWQYLGHRWEGPAHLDRVEGVAAFFDGRQRPTPDRGRGPRALGMVLVGDEFSPGRRGGGPREVRRWVGGRHHLRLIVFYESSNLPYREMASRILSHLPADIEMMPGTAEWLREAGFNPPHTKA